MSHPIPTEAATLAQRLRALADEIESAARYGVPIPFMVGASGHKYGDTSFSATTEEFDAWVTYAEADVETYEHAGYYWRRAVANINGLPLSFSAKGAHA